MRRKASLLFPRPMAEPRSGSRDFPVSSRQGPLRTAFYPALRRSSLSLPYEAYEASHCRKFAMVLTRWFGVTVSDADRSVATEKSDIDEIAAKSVLMQANAATAQHRSLCRGTHASGVCVGAQFEIFDVVVSHSRELAARLAKGIFAKPGIYPAVVRFANADSNINSDLKPDVRSLSFSVDLTRDGTASVGSSSRQDFSMQNATTLPINDSTAFLATIKVLTALNPVAGLWSLSFKDKLRVMRTLALAELQAVQKIRPYQQLRYWSTVPFRHGPDEVVKFSAIPSPENPARPLQKGNPKGLQDELTRHITEDSQMSRFDFAVQFLDAAKMTYWGQTRDANFWIENASVEWSEAEAPFHQVARLTLVRNLQLSPEASETIYFDVTGNSTPNSK